mmetsp:Transcript_82375/g.256037  ORF Transcript_82375/g.256037 Transcript_82375/m.256037 type:complete len:797 (+) Transcript_82375:80-2470(+)
MLSSLFFGSALEGPVDPPVSDGHRGIDVIIDGQALRVDVDALAEASGLFLQVQSTSAQECTLEDFPGGIAVFRQIIGLLVEPKGETQLQVTDDTVLNLFEAAWLLECPRVFDEVMDSLYMHSLSSRRKVELLEHLLPFTAASSPAEELDPQHERSVEEEARECGVAAATMAEEHMRIFLLETTMWQRTERVAVELAGQLDAGDFLLGPRLATGSLRICCELLRLHQKRGEDAGLVSSAWRPVSAVWKDLTDRPLRAKVSWDAHLFALQCMRKRLPAGPDGEAAAACMAGEHEEDEEAKADIPDELCICVDDRVLRSFAELVRHVDVSRAPPNWTALLIRTLLLSGQYNEARSAFAEAFPNSPRLRLLAWRSPPLLPAAWLSDVAGHVEASEVLLRVLGRYREIEAEEFCNVLEHVLLESFLSSPHCAPIILASELVNEIVGACFDAGRKVREPRPPPPGLSEDNQQGSHTSGASELAVEAVDCDNSTLPKRRCPRHWEGQHLLWRLEHLGTRLFEAAFVPQCGFLPHAWPDSVGTAVDLSAGRGSSESNGLSSLEGSDPGLVHVEPERPCQLEPLVLEVAGTCLWDEGLLQIELLRPIMDAGCAAPHEPTLHFGQQVIVRHLWHHFRGSYCEVLRLSELWELARWPLCQDSSLIREALEYLKGTYRELLASGMAWTPECEDALFRMFAALDLQRLPSQVLLSPWVPSQAQVVRLLLLQQPAEQIHAELQQEVASAMESLKSIRVKCTKLANTLNIVEQRTVINKSQINDAIVVIEEHQRKRSQAVHPPRRLQASER